MLHARAHLQHRRRNANTDASLSSNPDPPAHPLTPGRQGPTRSASCIRTKDVPVAISRSLSLQQVHQPDFNQGVEEVGTALPDYVTGFQVSVAFPGNDDLSAQSLNEKPCPSPAELMDRPLRPRTRPQSVYSIDGLRETLEEAKRAPSTEQQAYLKVDREQSESSGGAGTGTKTSESSSAQRAFQDYYANG